MRWGDGEAQFVRPAHRLIMMLGNRVIPGQVLGLASGDRTLGHRFMGEGEVRIAHADNYLEALEQRGSVLASFARRREVILDGLRSASERHGGCDCRGRGAAR